MTTTKTQYLVTKEFTDGLLAGITINIVTPVEFKPGFVAKAHGWVSPSGYIVRAVKDVTAIVRELESLKIGFTKCIGVHVVTRWAENSFELDTYGRDCMTIDQAAAKLA